MKQLATGDMDVYNTVLENLAYVAESICRNAFIEGLMKQSSLSIRDELRQALIKLYAAILIFLAKAGKYYKQRTASKSETSRPL
jgi:hypothetical protein